MISEEIKRDLEEHLSKKPTKPYAIKLIYNNSTLEALLFGMHANWPAVGLVSAEAGIIVNGRALADFGTINLAWDGASIHVERRTSASYLIKKPRLTISAMLQPKVFYQLLERRGDEARGMGLFARCFISQPDSTQGKRYAEGAPLDSQLIHNFNARVTELLTANVLEMKKNEPKRTVIEFSVEAKIRWLAVYNEIEFHLNQGGFFADVRDYASKLAENIARLSALFHYFEGDAGDISLDTLNRSIEVSLWYADEFKRLFSPKPVIPQDQADAMLLEDWLADAFRRYGFQNFKKNHIRQRCPNELREKSRLNLALEYLAFDGRIRIVTVDKTTFVELDWNYFSFVRGQQNQGQQQGGYQQAQHSQQLMNPYRSF